MDLFIVGTLTFSIGNRISWSHLKSHRTTAFEKYYSIVVRLL